MSAMMMDDERDENAMVDAESAVHEGADATGAPNFPAVSAELVSACLSTDALSLLLTTTIIRGIPPSIEELGARQTGSLR